MTDKIIESLKDYRDDHKLSDRAIAKLLGVHWNSVYNWFSGRERPSTLARARIKEFLIKNL